MDLYETTFEIKYLRRAVCLNEILLKEFWDYESGGFYFTSTKSESLIARQKEVYDGAIPSGNSVSLLNLIRLSRFTGDTALEVKSSKMVEYYSGYISKSPSVFTHFISSLDFYFGSTYEIVISSDSEDKTIKDALDLIRSSFNPGKVVVLNLSNQVKEISKVIPFIKDMAAINSKTTFFVCKNFSCNTPVHTISELKKLLGIL
jgi:uncharacterized protein YyaL (SSP411 family)